MPRAALFLVGFLILSFPAPPLAADQLVPWSKLKDAAGMKDSERKVVMEVFKKENCYAGCSDTILQCLKEEADNRTVLRIANFVIRRAKKYQPAEAIREDLKKRALSVYPPKLGKIDLSENVPSGNPNAPIKIVAYADFECPYCNIASPALRRISRERPDLVVYYFKNFPIKSHTHALPGCLALEAANRQGKFWKMHDYVYKEKDLNHKGFLEAAKAIGLDVAKFEKDMKDDSLLYRIRKDKVEGLTNKVIGTPGIFINGKYYQGRKSYEELLDRILEEKDIIDGIQ